MKILIVLSVWLLLLPGLVAAQEHNLAEAEELVKSQISCSELNDEKLEIIGEYLMEQMHPGEQHVAMDEMMGGEGSISLREMHITIAKRIYCGEGAGGGMMMGPGMMGGMGPGYGYGYGIGAAQLFFWLLILAVIGGLAYYLIKDKEGLRKKGNALDILKERYARGDILREEYLEIKKDLER